MISVRTIAWALILVIFALSVVPAEARPVLASQTVEHVSIFAALGLFWGLSHPRHPALQVLGLAVYTGAIELVQLLVPGRHARLSDFSIDLIGGLAGLAIAFAVAFVRSRRAESKQIAVDS